MQRKPKVFVINRGGHDYSAAKRFGEIEFLSEGKKSRYAITEMYRDFAEKLKDSQPDDFLMPTSLKTMSMVASAMLAYMHGKVNWLLHKDGYYVVRTLSLGELLQKEKGEKK